MTLQCPLGKCQPEKRDFEKEKHEAWHEIGFLAVSVGDTRLTWFIREMVVQVGNFLYGERKAKR